jgi:1-acyl-sn-glycerol-3-phosphate acyltransferase
VANTLGQRWNQTDWAKYTGRAHIEFLEPIAPGLDKDDFMTLLQDQIETRSIELLDLDNPGALDPADIGKLEENEVALAKRLAREAEAG